MRYSDYDGTDFRNPALNDCMICYEAAEELRAAWSLIGSLRGEMAIDCTERDIDLFERILEEHPNHELTAKDSLMAQIGFVGDSE